MDQPSNTQVEAASAVLRQYATQYGATAADNRTRTAVFSMAACLGFPGVPAEEYVDAIAERTGGDVRPNAAVRVVEGGFEIEDTNVLGIKAGRYRLVRDDDFDDNEVGGMFAALNGEQLFNLNKDDLIAAINRETSGELEKGDGTKAQLIDALLVWRAAGGRDSDEVELVIGN